MSADVALAVSVAIGLAGGAFVVWLLWPDTRSCQERNEEEFH